jgi:hypothetical protein
MVHKFLPGGSLHGVYLPVETATMQQFVVGALLGDAAILQDHDRIRELGVGQFVRDEKGRAPYHKALQGFHHGALILFIKPGGRLVQYQYRRTAYRGAGYSYALALSVGEG